LVIQKFCIQIKDAILESSLLTQTLEAFGVKISRTTNFPAVGTDSQTESLAENEGADILQI